MTLRGTRGEWEALVRRNDEGGVGLKDEHLASIQHALDEAPPDALVVYVDAMLPGLQQVRARDPESNKTRSMASVIADNDESWWIHRSRVLGLMSICPVGPWPRKPEIFKRPPGYQHDFGPSR